MIAVLIQVVAVFFLYNHIARENNVDNFGTGLLFYLVSCLFAVIDFIWLLIIAYRGVQ